MKKIRKKSIFFVIIALFIGAGIIPSITGNNFGDVIDQECSINSGDAYALFDPSLELGYYIGQLFKPAVNTLVKIDLLFEKYGNPLGTIFVEIRDFSPDGHLLASSSCSAESIPGGGFNWIEFDINDIFVTPDDWYFIKCWTNIPLGDDSLWWGAAPWGSDPYPRGAALYSPDGINWYGSGQFDDDMNFRTIGKTTTGNLMPSVFINYPKNNDVVSGTITITGNASDPNGDATIKWVMLNIDNTGWVEADGTSSWSYEWDSTTVEDGRHTLGAICFDGRLQSPTRSIEFYVDNIEDPEPEKNPDLECEGSLSWSDIKPGLTIINSFTVENNGDSGSDLNWTITDIPEWGTWTFTPENGSGLTPELGEITVQVSLVAPDEKDQNFTGEIKVVNKENASDYEIIDVSLSTPKNKIINTPFITFLQNHQRFFPLIRQILGLKI